MTTHRIETIKELMDLATTDNMERLMQDLTACVKGATAMKALGCESAGYIEWTDDHKREITFNIETPTKP